MTTTIEATTVKLSMAGAVKSAMDTALALDDSVILLGEDVADPAGGAFKVTKGLSTRHGAERVRSTPIAEQSILGAAIGAALGGLKPIAEIMFFDFITVAADQLANHAAKLRYMSGGATPVPITVRTTIGSSRFGAQHAQELEAWFMHIPGIKVVMPATPAEAKGLLLSCIFDPDPCLFIEHSRLLFAPKAEVPVGDERIPLGRAAVKRTGSDATVITYGSYVAPVLKAAEQLAQDGISIEVIDLRTLAPLDTATILASVAKTKAAMVVHAATKFCGPGAEVASLITEELFGELRGPVVRLGGAYAPIPFAAELRSGPGTADIAAAVRTMLTSSPALR